MTLARLMVVPVVSQQEFCEYKWAAPQNIERLRAHFDDPRHCRDPRNTAVRGPMKSHRRYAT